MKRLVMLYLLFTLFIPSVQAFYNPLSVPNNKFGIHIADVNDIPNVASLVNSTGGDWGYVTLVIAENDRDVSKWQYVFNLLRRLHLIPIVRLATYAVGPVWAIPQEERLGEWVTFLTSLNWPVENRYVVLFNEPNHAGEWQGRVDPEAYAQVLVALGYRLKEASDDFFILPAGLDASAATTADSLDEATFLQRMVAKNPKVLDIIDGWTSHSYPNPGFSGSPYASGRGTLRTYEWELAYLNTLGLNKALPVFITETGWAHNQGFGQNGRLSTDEVGKNIEVAAASAWGDNRIVAVTPFVFNYQSDPFGQFSWRMKGALSFYPQYYTYQSIPKMRGQPKQRHHFMLRSALIPAVLVSGSTYSLQADLVNEGQSILRASEGYELNIADEKRQFSSVADPLPVLEPGESGRISISLKTAQVEGPYNIVVSLQHNSEKIILQNTSLLLTPPPSVAVSGWLGWKRASNSPGVTILVYDDKTLIHKITGLTMTNGVTVAKGLYNLIPGKEYRIVLLVPGYLPRQTTAPLTSGRTNVNVKRLLPLDANEDGKFDVADIISSFTSPPAEILSRFFGP